MCSSAVKSRPREHISPFPSPLLLLLLRFFSPSLSGSRAVQARHISWTRPRSPTHRPSTTPIPVPLHPLARMSALAPSGLSPHSLQPNSFASHRRLCRGPSKSSPFTPTSNPTQCKRLKLKCDRRTPCGSCTKRDTVARCVYSPAAAEKVSVPLSFSSQPSLTPTNQRPPLPQQPPYPSRVSARPVYGTGVTLT